TPAKRALAARAPARHSRSDHDRGHAWNGFITRFRPGSRSKGVPRSKSDCGRSASFAHLLERRLPAFRRAADGRLAGLRCLRSLRAADFAADLLGTVLRAAALRPLPAELSCGRRPGFPGWRPQVVSGAREAGVGFPPFAKYRASAFR